jgi:hypothetical protein
MRPMTQQQQQIQQQQQPWFFRKGERPKRRDIFLHGGKTFKLIGALMKDRRIHTLAQASLCRQYPGIGCAALFPGCSW